MLQKGEPQDAAGLRTCIEALCDDDIARQTAQTGDNQPRQVNDALTAELNARTLQRLPGDNWRVTSYSGLQQRGHGIAQDLMPRLDVDAAGVVSVVEEPTLTPHQFPRGASPGTFLHSLFEDLDFTQPVDPNWVQEKLELGGFEPQWEPVLTEWITAVLRAPLNETGVSLNQLSDRDKQVEMEFYLPISEPLIASQLDALIRQFDPLSAGCPPLEFMQVRGMLKGFIDWCSATKGVITCSTINPTGWVKTVRLTPNRLWQRQCRHTAMICNISFIPWRCTVICAIVLLITTMSATLAALFICSCAALIKNIRNKDLRDPTQRRVD